MLPSWIWAMQKEIKDAYPKKACHMLKRHVRKKIKKRCIPKEGMPHAHKACQKKRETKKRKREKRKEKDSPHPWKIKKRDGSCKGVHPSSTQKKIFPHTCTS